MTKRFIKTKIFNPFPNLVAVESTRHGGISPAPFNSLNLGNFTDDKLENIVENRRLILEELGFGLTSFCYSKQTHEDKVYFATQAEAVEGFDAIITNVKGLMIGVTIADCTPILIYDAQNEAIAAIHAGWKGTVLGIVSKTLEAMNFHFNTQAQNCFAYIGTCIDVCDFEVGEEVANQFDTDFKIWKSEKNKYHVDLKRANAQWLLEAGIPAQHIEISPRSTASQTEDYFSHRTEKGLTGRMMALIGMLSFIFCLFSTFSFAQNTHQLLQKGDAAYKNKDFTSAEQFYRQVDVNGKSSGRAAYNLGNCLYQQQRFDEAIVQYQKATQQLWKPEDEALAYYNLGNAFFEKQDYPKSIEAYKNALRRNPNDLAAKKNLMLAMRKLQQQQNQQNRPPQQPNPSPKNQKSKQNEQENQEQNRLLQVAQEEEQKTQRKDKKQAKTKKVMEKDW